MMHSLQIWTLAIRPKTLIAGISPVIIGSILSLSLVKPSFLIFIFTLLTSLGIQIGANLANDYFDCIKGSDTKARKGPLRVTHAGLVSLHTMKRAIALTFFLTTLCGSYLVYQGGIIIAGLVAVSILLALFYTGGPFPLAYLGLGDIFVLIFYGPVAVCGTYYLQTHSLCMDVLVAGLAPGALSCAVLVANNLRDIDEDRQANKKTLPVRFGLNFGKFQYLFSLLVAFSIPIILCFDRPFALIGSLFIIPAIPLIKFVIKHQEPADFIPLLPKTAELLLIYTLLFSIGWIL